MYQEPVTFIVPAGMSPMRRKVIKKFEALEKQAKTRERITWKTLTDFYVKTHKDWENQSELVDQHTGGEEFIERWWSGFFIPRFNDLRKAKLAQGRRLAGHGR